jgi:hypothetical protein
MTDLMVEINDDDIPACVRCGNGPVIVGDRYGNDGVIIDGRLFCMACASLVTRPRSASWPECTSPDKPDLIEDGPERDARFIPGNNRLWGEHNWFKCYRCRDSNGLPVYHHWKAHHGRRVITDAYGSSTSPT